MPVSNENPDYHRQLRWYAPAYAAHAVVDPFFSLPTRSRSPQSLLHPGGVNHPGSCFLFPHDGVNAAQKKVAAFVPGFSPYGVVRAAQNHWNGTRGRACRIRSLISAWGLWEPGTKTGEELDFIIGTRPAERPKRFNAWPMPIGVLGKLITKLFTHDDHHGSGGKTRGCWNMLVGYQRC